MGAWDHSNTWGRDTMAGYRDYVEKEVPKRKGSTADCADISMSLLIDYAEKNHLTVSFFDNNNVMYSSKAKRQIPSGAWDKKWSNKVEFRKAVFERIGSEALLNKNTFEVKQQDLWPGDLIVKGDHTALIFAVWPPGRPHPRVSDKNIPDFPGAAQAAKQLNTLEYFATPRVAGKGGIMSCVPASMLLIHVDHLNHRGENHKEMAELIYFRSTQELQQQGFKFKRYTGGNAFTTLYDWTGWNGEGNPIQR